MTDDGWQTVWFGKPYPDLARSPRPQSRSSAPTASSAPTWRCSCSAVWLGALYLRRFNPDGLALLFSAGFFLLSNAFAYVFWIHTEVLCMASVTACLYLAFTPGLAGGADRPLGALPAHLLERRQPARPGRARRSSPAAYNKPILALLGLPALYLAYRAERLRGAAQVARRRRGRGRPGLRHLDRLHRPPLRLSRRRALGRPRPRLHPMPDLPIARSEAYKEAVPEASGPRNSWSWIFRLPEVDRRLPENAGYFFVGRHTGLLLYAPFSGICLLLFALYSRRSPGALGGARRARRRRALLPDAHSVQLARRRRLHRQPILRQRPAGAALPGHPHRARAGWRSPVSRSAAIFVAPILFTPFGAPVPSPTLQAHVRNAPFRFFPYERTLARQIPGYRGQVGSGVYFFGRRDVLSSVGESLWAVGGKPVELWVHTDLPLTRPVFQIETAIAPNRVSVELGHDRKEIHFDSATAPGNTTRITLAPGAPKTERADDGSSYFAYKMWIEASAQTFRTEVGPGEAADRGGGGGARAGPACRAAAGVRGGHLPGRRRGDLSRRRGRPRGRRLPARMARREAAGRVACQPAGPCPGDGAEHQPAVWPARGATRVALAYHWLDSAGQPVIFEGLRSALPRRRRPGRERRGRARDRDTQEARRIHPRARRAARATRLVLGQAARLDAALARHRPAFRRP